MPNTRAQRRKKNPPPPAPTVEPDAPGSPTPSSESLDSDDEDAGNAVPRRRRPVNPWRSLQPAVEEHLAEWFHDNPLFYDSNHIDHKNNGKMDRCVYLLFFVYCFNSLQ
jgi:hypothetical protein